MLSKEEIEFRSSLEKMFNYLKNKKELTEFEKLVIINFDYITKKVLSPECKTATEIVSKTMYYELIKRKEEYYEKQIDQLESDKQKITEKLLELEFKKSSCVNSTQVEYIYEEFVQELEKILKFEDFLK